MRYKKEASFLHRLYFSIFIIIFISFFISAVILTIKIKNTIESNFSANNIKIAKALVESIRVPLVEDDRPTLLRIFSNVISQSDYLYILIINEKEEVIVSLPNDQFLGLILEDPISLRMKDIKELTAISYKTNKSDDILEVGLPIRFIDSDEKIGLLRIGFNANENKKIIIQNLIFMASLFLLILSFALFAFRIIGNRFTQPIKNIIQEIEKRSKIPIEKLNPLTEMGEYIETSALTKNINFFISQIKFYYSETKRNEKLAAIGQLSNMLAHDVRKPFAIVKNFLHQLPQRRFDDSFLAHYTKEIEHTLRSVENMIEDVLEYSRTKEPTLEKCNPQSLINSAITEAIRNFTESKIQFKYNFNHKHILHIDTFKAERLFTNIITNAIEAMKENGNIWFETREVGLDFRLHGNDARGKSQTDSKAIEFVIGNHNSKDGPVIPQDKIEYIFESFFTSGKVKGTGLGLAISKKVVESHGGRISCTSDGIKGTEFRFTLPTLGEEVKVNESELLYNSQDVAKLIQASKITNTEIEEKINIVKGRCSNLNRKLNLAIVDDEPIFRNSLRNLITSSHELVELINIFEVHNGEKALELLQSQEIEYMVIDIDMGIGINGMELAEIINKDYKNTQFVIHSNRLRSEYEKEAKKIGATAFIPKPMDMDNLIKFLGSIIPPKVLQIKKENESIKFFIADDSYTIRDYLGEMVKESFSDAEICLCEKPEEVLEKIEIEEEKKMPLIVISDNDFGKKSDMTGIELLKKVREIDDGILTYLCSNQPMSLLIESAKIAGATGYFNPDISAEDLKRKIEKDLKSLITVGNVSFTNVIVKPETAKNIQDEIASSRTLLAMTTEYSGVTASVIASPEGEKQSHPEHIRSFKCKLREVSNRENEGAVKLYDTAKKLLHDGNKITNIFIMALSMIKRSISNGNIEKVKEQLKSLDENINMLNENIDGYYNGLNKETFSLFEPIYRNYKNQAREIREFILNETCDDIQKLVDVKLNKYSHIKNENSKISEVILGNIISLLCLFPIP